MRREVASPVVALLLFILPKPKQIKQPRTTPKVDAPPRLPARRTEAALPIKAIRALAYRVESSRIGGSLSRGKTAAYRSLEDFAAAVEIDKGIAAAVRDEFPSEPGGQIPIEPKRS